MSATQLAFLLFNTTKFAVRKCHDDAVMSTDPIKQARILCAILVSAVPSQTCRAFMEMTGGSMDKLCEVGNDPELHRHHTQRPSQKLTPQQKIGIKRAMGSAMAVAQRFHCHRSTVYRLWKDR